jgi:hypothetical protein
MVHKINNTMDNRNKNINGFLFLLSTVLFILWTDHWCFYFYFPLWCLSCGPLMFLFLLSIVLFILWIIDVFISIVHCVVYFDFKQQHIFIIHYYSLLVDKQLLFWPKQLSLPLFFVRFVLLNLYIFV